MLEKNESATIEEIPVMEFGKYKGVRIDQIPMSYLRWILSQDFPEHIKKYARAKVSANPTGNFAIDITRHAYDSFSLRFLDKWDKKMGIGSFIAMKATQALSHGRDVSKARHQDEELIKEFEGIKWVFNRDGELKCLITVM